MNSLPLLVAVVLPFIISVLSADTNENIISAYGECDESWTDTSLVCDPDSLLKDTTRNRLEYLLRRVQTDTQCMCYDKSNCFKYDDTPIQSAYVAAILVVDSVASDLTTTVNTLQSIYQHKEMNSSGCDNGIIILYAKRNATLYSYRGSLSYSLLSHVEEYNFHRNLQMMTTVDEDRALATLVNQYTRGLQAQHDHCWGTIVGMAIAGVLALAVLSLLCALACSAAWGSSSWQIKQDYYKTGSLPPSQEPIYVISEPTDILDESQQDIYYIDHQLTISEQDNEIYYPENTHEIQRRQCMIYDDDASSIRTSTTIDNKERPPPVPIDNIK